MQQIVLLQISIIVFLLPPLPSSFLSVTHRNGKQKRQCSVLTPKPGWKTCRVTCFSTWTMHIPSPLFFFPSPVSCFICALMRSQHRLSTTSLVFLPVVRTVNQAEKRPIEGQPDTSPGSISHNQQAKDKGPGEGHKEASHRPKSDQQYLKRRRIQNKYLKLLCDVTNVFLLPVHTVVSLGQLLVESWDCAPWVIKVCIVPKNKLKRTVYNEHYNGCRGHNEMVSMQSSYSCQLINLLSGEWLVWMHKCHVP